MPRRFHGMMRHRARLPHMHTLTDPNLLNDIAEIGNDRPLVGLIARCLTVSLQTGMAPSA